MPDIFSLLKSLGNVDITRYSDSEILTPQNIVSDMVDLLPQEVFNPDTTFLDPAVKSGRFLKEIYNRLFNSPLLSYMNEKERREHILHNQLFGLATSPTAATLSRAMLYDTAVYRGNIVYADNYIARVSSSKGKDIKRIIEGAFAKDMTFDVIIGNPPYQNATQSIYPYFIEAAIDLAPKVCMITKNNWLESDVLSKTRKRMVNAGLDKIINYPNIGALFPGVAVSVSIFLVNQGKKNKTEYIEIMNGKRQSAYTADLSELPVIPTNRVEYDIAMKVMQVMQKSLSRAYQSKMPFNINTNGRLGATGNDCFVNQNNKKSEKYSIPVLYTDGNKTAPYFMYAMNTDITKNKDLINQYKLICSRIMSKDNTVIRSIYGLRPGQVCSGSFSLIYCSSNVDEIVAVSQYVHSRFFRILVRMTTGKMNGISPYRFSLVPDQDFSSNSDIDWSQTVADIDKQLYKKYNLSQEEIDYIEQTINPYD